MYIYIYITLDTNNVYKNINLGRQTFNYIIVNRLFLNTHEYNNNTADLSTNTEENVFSAN